MRQPGSALVTVSLFFLLISLAAAQYYDDDDQVGPNWTICFRLVHLDVGCRGLFRGIASPTVLCHKEPARASKRKIPPLALGGILLAPRWFFMLAQATLGKLSTNESLVM